MSIMRWLLGDRVSLVSGLLCMALMLCWAVSATRFTGLTFLSIGPVEVNAEDWRFNVRGPLGVPDLKQTSAPLAKIDLWLIRYTEGHQTYVPYRSLSTPMWFLVVLTSILPLRAMVRKSRFARALQTNHC